MSTPLSRSLAAPIAVLALLGDVLLLRLQMAHDHAGVVRAILTDTLFFSDLSNLLVAVVFGLLALASLGRHRSWMLGLALTCILLTFVGSNGWRGFMRSMSVNTLVHTWVPLLTALWCVAFTVKGQLRWSHVVTWTLVGVSYLPYVFLRGALTSRYPYPWLDPQRVGWPAVMLPRCSSPGCNPVRQLS